MGSVVAEAIHSMEENDEILDMLEEASVYGVGRSSKPTSVYGVARSSKAPSVYEAGRSSKAPSVYGGSRRPPSLREGGSRVPSIYRGGSIHSGGSRDGCFQVSKDTSCS